MRAVGSVSMHNKETRPPPPKLTHAKLVFLHLFADIKFYVDLSFCIRNGSKMKVESYCKESAMHYKTKYMKLKSQF